MSSYIKGIQTKIIFLRSVLLNASCVIQFTVHYLVMTDEVTAVRNREKNVHTHTYTHIQVRCVSISDGSWETLQH